MGKKYLSEGDGIDTADHPSFRDPVYVQRRKFISNIALSYSILDQSIPNIEYTEEENLEEYNNQILLDFE